MAPTSKSRRGPSVPGTPQQMTGPYQPTADLPGLYPVHDGSYGVNTLLNLDSAKKKGRKAKSGFTNEDAEDKKFKKHVKKGGKQYGMETDLKKAVDKSQKEANTLHTGAATTAAANPGSDSPHHSNAHGQYKTHHPSGTSQNFPGGGAPNQSPIGGDPNQTGEGPNPPPTSGSPNQKGKGPNPPPAGEDPNQAGIDPNNPPDDFELPAWGSYTYTEAFPMPPQVPKYIGHLFYNTSDHGEHDDEDEEPTNPYEQPELTSASPHPLIGNSHPPAPPAEHAPFYGMPQGVGGSTAFTPFRPDSSRSFSYESGLYGDATLQSPAMPPPPVPISTSQTGSATKSGYVNSSSQAAPVTTGGYISPPSDPTATSIGAKSHEAISGSNGPPPIFNNPYITPESSNSSKPGLGLLDIHNTSPQTYEANNVSITPTHQEVTTTQNVTSNQTQAKPQYIQGDDTTTNNSATSTSNAIYTTGGKKPGNSSVKGTSGGVYSNGKKTNIHGGSNSSGNNNDSNRPSSSWRYYWRMLAKIPRLIKRLMLSDFIISLLQAILVFVVMLVGVWGIMSLVHQLASVSTDKFSGASPSLPGFGLSWPDWSGMRDSIAEYIPTPSRGRASSIFSDTWESDSPWAASPKAGDGKSGSLKDLKDSLPGKVFVESSKDGKLRISQDFWHAFRDQIMADDFILTLEEAKNRAPTISDKHWLAVKSRIEKGGFSSPCKDSTGKPCVMAKDVDNIVQDSLSQSWENWIRQNDHSLKQLVGGVAVTKDEFLNLFKEEARTYQKEIRTELDGLDGRVKSLISEVSKLRDAPVSPGGMTQPEVKALVESAVAKAVSSAKLDAVANGRIRGHAADMEFNQVNFFGQGSGVVIDPFLTSQPWRIPVPHFKSRKWYETPTYRSNPPATALSPWSQEGECFCAGPDLKGNGQGTNNISLMLSRNIVPQHLVVEHILSGSTLDPGAMPKDIEVWTYVEELNLRNELHAYFDQTFPDARQEQVLNEGWVKIGQFRYQNKNHGDGVQVFKITDELARMGAFTNHILVRAISNYGADHTCFYRLRLYGDEVDVPLK